MSALFLPQRVNPLGERLKEARLNKGMTIKKSSLDLNIPIKYLEALENNQPSALPGPEYFDKFLTAYAGHLGVPIAEALALKSDKIESKSAHNTDTQRHVAWSEYLGRFLVIGIAVVLVLFLLLKVNAIFMPPNLTIISPSDGLITSSRELNVDGVSTPEAEIIINNKAVFVDPSGKFTTSVDLQKGLNLIKITAKKRYSRIREVEIRVLLND